MVGECHHGNTETKLQYRNVEGSSDSLSDFNNDSLRRNGIGLVKVWGQIEENQIWNQVRMEPLGLVGPSISGERGSYFISVASQFQTHYLEFLSNFIQRCDAEILAFK